MSHPTQKFLILLSVICVGLFAMTPVHAANEKVIDSTYVTTPTEGMIDAINANTIHFDHASVGSNVMEGLGNVVINSKSVTLEDDARGNPGAVEKVTTWYDELVARNTDGSPADDIDIAVFKWCYIDEDLSGAPDNLAGLQTAMQNIRNHANSRVNTVKILIFTVPLETYASTTKIDDNTRIKALTSTFSNVWVYDIADFESHHTNGSACLSGSTPILCSEYTSDGGHPATADGMARVSHGFLLSLYQVASNSALQPTVTTPASLLNVYFTFGHFRYNKYASPAALRSGDTAYIKNFNSSQLRLLQVFLYDYAKHGNQGYTKSRVTSTSMYLRTNYYLPTGKRYAYVFKFQDKSSGMIATKYFVVYTTKTWLGHSTL